MRLPCFAAGFLVALIFSAVTAWAMSQAVAVEPVTPRIMAGGDVGFRVEGLRGSTPVGTVVVRVNGEWVEAEVKLPGRGTTPLSSQ